MVLEWARILSYDLKHQCSPCESYSSPRRSSLEGPPCATHPCVVVAMKFVASTLAATSPDPIRTFPLSRTLSIAHSSPTFIDWPTSFSGMQDMISVSAYGI
ncbi:hypothetical protein GOBAR_DD09655 [Gossypium barbadense]|nr:hypothetical protein GOBAR_DD09655 [Gossypium barbadense]